MSLRNPVIIVVLVLLSGHSFADTVLVPNDFPTIQGAIDAAAYGDTVLVSAGTYFETLVMQPGINLAGTDAENTVIDGQGTGNNSGTVIVAADGLSITGLTIRNGNNDLFNNLGACIDTFSSSVTIRGNWIINCRVGVRTGGSPIIERNVIIDQSLVGIWAHGDGSPVVRNNTLFANRRGIQWSDRSTIEIVNNVIVGTSDSRGILKFGEFDPELKFNDVYGNLFDYLDLPDQTGINGNISVDPQFIDPVDRDFRLSSKSPVVNAGDPTCSADADRSVADIGALPLGANKLEPDVLLCPRPYFFEDVPTDHWAISFIELVAAHGLTSGCGGNDFCPSDVVTRAQMAVFLLRARHGADYVPPPPTGNRFGDVDPGYWAAGWIEQLATEGITGGCGNGSFCPLNPVTRAQMAVFLLRTLYGSTYRPPDATGIFTDVLPEYWAANWIEQLAALGITSGCGDGRFCPDDQISRDQMAVFLVRTFGLSNAPVAVRDEVTTHQYKSISIDVTANDFIPYPPGACSLVPDGIGTAQVGTARLGSHCVIEYYPAWGVSTSDSFTYTVIDSNGETSVGVVDVFVANTGRVFSIAESDRVARLVWEDISIDGSAFGSQEFNSDDLRLMTRKVFEFVGDDFDFVVYVQDCDRCDGAFGVFTDVRNDIAGIGRDIFDIGSNFGSSQRLTGVVYLRERSFVKHGPMLHEILHNWAVDIMPPDGQPIWGTQAGHWGIVGTPGQLGGFDPTTLVDLGGGQYQANNGRPGVQGFGLQANGGNSVPYSSHELYVMGLIPASVVPPLIVPINPVWLGSGNFSAAGLEQQSIDEIIARVGTRSPAYGQARSQFKLLVVLFAKYEPSDERLQEVGEDIGLFAFPGVDTDDSLYNFYEATNGAALIEAGDLSLSLIN